MLSRQSTGRVLYSPRFRFGILVAPGAIFVCLFLFVPLLSIIVFSFWRTDNLEIIPEWNVDNYRLILTEASYLTFLWRSIWTAFIVSMVSLVFGWPTAYLIAKHGGNYRLILVLLIVAPFFTGLVLRLIALQHVLGPVGLINMGLTHFGLAPITVLMYTKTASIIGLIYLWLPFMIAAIYLSLLNFDFELLEVAKVYGAKPWRAFIKVTWPLNRLGTAIGFILVFIPCLAASITPRFLGGADAALFATTLTIQFGEIGTWALGSAMGVVLFLVSLVVMIAVFRFVDLRRSGFTGIELR